MAVNPLENVAPDPTAQPPSTGEPARKAVPLEQKYGGDWNKANEGYFNAVNALTQRSQALDQLVPQMQRLEAVVGALLGGGGSQPADPSDVLAQELGLQSPDSLKRGVRGEVESVLTELFGPFVSQIQADEKLANEIDGFEQLRSDARAFMKANPEVAETFNAVRAVNPERAWKYAIRETLISKAGAQPSGGNPVSLPGSATPAGRGAPGPQPDQGAREAEALEYGNKFGDYRHYRHERFKGTSIERAIDRANQQAGLTPMGPITGW